MRKVALIWLIVMFVFSTITTGVSPTFAETASSEEDAVEQTENQSNEVDQNEEEVTDEQDSEEIKKEEEEHDVEESEELEEVEEVTTDKSDKNDTDSELEELSEENKEKAEEGEIAPLSDSSNPYEIGDQGEHVRELKQNLTKLGFGNFPNNPSKNYGKVTSNVIKEFQKYANLEQTGNADDTTLSVIEKVLNPPYENGDRGIAISELKQDLTKLGYGNFPKNPSIHYGNVTANVVKSFQKDQGLETSGKANEATLNEIEEQINKGLTIGQNSNTVREMKKDLRKLGFGNFPKNPSKTYGKVTANVVKDFQKSYKLSQTGIADSVTLDKIEEVLNPPYKNGDQGQAIVNLKKDLSKLNFGNFPKNPSIFYGKTTNNVVKQFQKAFGLKQTGVADQKTLNKIDEIVNSSYSIGKKGKHVRKLKQDLTKLGFGKFPKNPSKTYGKVTANVVKDFQRYAKLPQTGVADQTTLDRIKEKINPPYQTGDRGQSIVKLKKDLTKLGFGNFPKNPSNAYGKVTANVVKDFQKYAKLKQTGIADQTTLNKIKEIVNPPYKTGDRGQTIVQLKKDLTKLGFGNFPKKPSNAYGKVTANVVKDFQKYAKLKQTGIANKATLDKIKKVVNPPYQTGDRGQAIVKLKEDLTKLDFGNFPKNPSMSYGKVTANVVKKFQKANGLTTNGVANNQTLKKVAAEVKKKNKTTSVVENMKKLNKSNKQVILVTTKGFNTYNAKVQTFEKNNKGVWKRVHDYKGYIGKNGFTANKREGDGKSPTGKYTIGTAFGYNGNPGTKLNFRHSTSNDVWVDDPKSKYYNTWQKNNRKGKDWNSAESMTHRLYRYGFVINYNTNQVPNKGSAIFMHTGTSYTVGCTAISQSNLINVMKWLDPKKNPVIIQTPESQLSKY